LRESCSLPFLHECGNNETMMLRILVLPVYAAATFAVVQSFGAQENRGWGSTWTTPRNEQERMGRDIAARLEKALRANDWSAVDKALADAQRAGFKSGSLQAARALVASRDRTTREQLISAIKLWLFYPGTTQRKRLPICLHCVLRLTF
jgi:hypothetical protein